MHEKVYTEHVHYIHRSMQKCDTLYIAAFYTFKDLLYDISGSSVSETLFGQIS